MAELDELRDEVHSLGREISELKPVVMEVHSNMPRIVSALETLARVTERQEADAAEHKRLHCRITEGNNNISLVRQDVAHLAERVDKINENQVVCQAGQKAKKEPVAGSLFARAKEQAMEKAIEIILLAILAFVVWLTIYHLPKYPVTAPIIEQGRLGRPGGRE